MKPKGLPYLVLKHIFNRLTYSFPRKKILKRNQIFKDQYQGKRCFILGSGSSIKKQDLKLLKDEIVFTQNNFYMHKDIKSINPTFHCIVPKYQDAKHDSDWVEWYTSMEKQLPDDVIYFPGLNSRDLIEKNGFFGDRCYYIDQGLNPVFLRKAKIDITRKIMDIPTVITECLTLALYMGFSEVYLLGMDLDQICTEHGSNKNRFYGKSHITKNDAEASIEAMHAKTGHAFLFYWWIFQQLNRLSILAEKNECKIYNCAPGGLLHTFERQRYEDLPFLKKRKTRTKRTSAARKKTKVKKK